MTAANTDLCNYCTEIFQPTQPTLVFEERILLSAEATATLHLRSACRICAIICSKLRPEQYGKEICVKIRWQDNPTGALLTVELDLPIHPVDRPRVELMLIPLDLAGSLEWSDCLPSHTNSKLSMEYVNKQLRNCLDNHQNCRDLATLDARLDGRGPTRLLDIAGEDIGKVYLRDGLFLKSYAQNQSPKTPINYATLSHCWGDYALPVLTKATMDDLASGVSNVNLPRTFKDAIQMIRTLGLRFLWIDSLCIFQDDLHDWSREASRMHLVYSNALCNLAATGSEHAGQGLFHEHDSRTDCPFWVNVSWPLDTMKKTPRAEKYLLAIAEQQRDSVELAPLNKRAWVMQERVLSRRVISFTRDQLFWECFELQANETFPNGLPKTEYPSWFYDKMILRKKIYKSKLEFTKTSRSCMAQEEFRLWRKSMYYAWRVFLISYTRCNLTKPEDKLVAIQGVAEEFGQQMQLAPGTDFVAGIWIPQLCTELCWFNHLDKEASERFGWRAPSWSWASIDAQIHPSSMRHHARCQTAIELINLVRINQIAGQPGFTSITVRGRLILSTMIVTTDAPQPAMGYVSLIASQVFTAGQQQQQQQQQQHVLNVAFDLPRQYRDSLEPVEVCLLPILACIHEEKDISIATGPWKTSLVEVLVLVQHNSRPNTYERIGLVTGSCMATELVDLSNSVQESDITLV